VPPLRQPQSGSHVGDAPLAVARNRMLLNTLLPQRCLDRSCVRYCVFALFPDGSAPACNSGFFLDLIMCRGRLNLFSSTGHFLRVAMDGANRHSTQPPCCNSPMPMPDIRASRCRACNWRTDRLRDQRFRHPPAGRGVFVQAMHNTGTRHFFELRIMMQQRISTACRPVRCGMHHRPALVDHQQTHRLRNMSMQCLRQIRLFGGMGQRQTHPVLSTQTCLDDGPVRRPIELLQGDPFLQTLREYTGSNLASARSSRNPAHSSGTTKCSASGESAF